MEEPTLQLISESLAIDEIDVVARFLLQLLAMLQLKFEKMATVRVRLGLICNQENC